MNGLILIDKPKEFTSFDVIAVVRRAVGQRKCGHTGTLDPNATGVLPILLGNATKAQDLIVNHDKTYVADFRLGFCTDTLDIWGKVTEEFSKTADYDEVLNASKSFEGEIEQIPPMFSAVQKNGQRLYDLARQGIEVERESRSATVYSINLLSFDEKSQSGQLEISCSKGTYVRTIIDDMGKMLGTGAVMTDLRRTKACGFDIADCVTLDRLKELCEKGEAETLLHSVESLFFDYEKISVSAPQARRFSNGGALDLTRTALRSRELNGGERFRVCSDGKFLGLGAVDKENNLLKIFKLFNPCF